MLGSKNKKTANVNARIGSIIGADMVVEGTITSNEAVRIDGKVKGDVCSVGALVIGDTVMVVGNIIGADIMIAGTVEGDLVSGGRTEVASTGRIMGNIQTRSLIVDENAIFQGQCNMNSAGTKMIEEVVE